MCAGPVIKAAVLGQPAPEESPYLVILVFYLYYGSIEGRGEGGGFWFKMLGEIARKCTVAFVLIALALFVAVPKSTFQNMVFGQREHDAKHSTPI